MHVSAFTRAIVAAGAIFFVAVEANAHIVLAEQQARAGAYFAAAFRVGHGCDAKATIAVRVEIPPGIVVARPQPKPGWTLSIERQKLARAVQSEYGPITERVSAIVWRGRLPADELDQFSILMRLPNSTGPLYFPTIQTCAAGERRWIDTPADGQAGRGAPSPAPVLMVRSAPDGQMEH